MPTLLRISFLSSLLTLLLLTSCTDQDTERDDGRLDLVATTSMITDLVRVIGGAYVDVEGLMGPGIDPHLYRARESDVAKMAGADAIFYHGLHLEGKMAEVFEQMESSGRKTIAVTGNMPESDLIQTAAFQGNYDPHVWFDVALWKRVAEKVRDELIALDPANAEAYRANAEAYFAELDALEGWVREQVARVPEEKRVLVTAHDAFGYFGRAYGFDVRGLQGISTATEAGTGDVQQLAEFIAAQQIPAMFVESSVPPRAIEAVQEAVQARGFDVRIGGHLFSDALGDSDSPEGTYLGTVRHNVSTIVNALGGNGEAQP